MSTFSRHFAAALLLAAMQARVVPAEDEVKSDPTPSKPSRAELRERQIDVSLEARDIERILGKLRKASDLSKSRITEAAKAAEAATSALERGESTAARGDARQAAEMFQEIAKLLAALLEEETPQRLAAARDMAQMLANNERQLADDLQGPMGQQGEPGKEPSKTKGAANNANSANPQKGTGTANQGDPTDTKDSGSADKVKSAAREKGAEEGSKANKENGTAVADTKANPSGPGADKIDKNNGTTAEKADPTKGASKDQPGNNQVDKEDPTGAGAGTTDKETDPPAENGTDEVKQNGPKGDKSKSPGAATAADNGMSTRRDPTEVSKGAGGAGEKKDPTDANPATGAGSVASNRDKMRGEGGDVTKAEPGRVRNSGGGKPSRAMTEEERREALAARAEQLARNGETLQDILKRVSESNEPADKEAVAKVEAILKETQLLKSIETMQGAAGTIRSAQLNEARLASLDIADRMQIIAQRLDTAYRTIVAPQVEELRKLEQNLAGLGDQLDKLETPAQVAAWQRKADELMDEAEKLQISDKLREEFLEQMKKSAPGSDGFQDLKWSLVNDRYVPPKTIDPLLTKIQEEVQARIQALVLGDFTSSAEENTPPKYQELVERYYQVLSREKGMQNRAAKSVPTKKSK